MRVEDLSVSIRPRHPWEAMDLGLGMARAWAGALYPVWGILLMAVYALLAALLHRHPWLAGLLVWWLKPLFDRVLLHVLSRAVFGAAPSLGETLRAIPSLLRGTGLLWHLTLHRYDFARSFRLPVLQLEGLSGAARRARLKVLGARARPHAVGLTLVMVHFEAILWIGLFGLVWMLVPAEYDFEFWSLGSDDAPLAGHGAWLCYVLAVFLLEPVYVAAGFSLYLSRRTLLEGWDVELGLKRLRTRLQQPQQRVPGAAPALLVLVCAGGFMSPAGEAAIADEPLAEQVAPAGEARSVIDAIMARDDFRRTRTVNRWIRPGDAREPSELPDWLAGLGRLLARLAEVALWAAAILAVLFVLWRARRLLPAPRGAQVSSPAPETVAGLAIRPETLPDDVVAAVLAAWQTGRQRQALGLLYRATLSRLVERHRVPLEASFTEDEVLRHAAPLLPVTHAESLAQATRLWQRVAYAHRAPGADEVQAATAAWAATFGASP